MFRKEEVRNKKTVYTVNAITIESLTKRIDRLVDGKNYREKFSKELVTISKVASYRHHVSLCAAVNTANQNKRCPQSTKETSNTEQTRNLERSVTITLNTVMKRNTYKK